MKIVDLFAGCGGMSLGFQNAGYEILAAFDNWDDAVKVYQLNFSHPILKRDISNFNESDYAYLEELMPEMIIGGPPCQDFSSAGKRDENLGRADLTIKFAEIVARLAAPWFVMENVGRISKSATLALAKEVLCKAGYGLTEKVLDASFHGVPQSRTRYFLIGELNGQDNALLPYLDSNRASKPMTVYDYLGDSLEIEYYYRHPRTYERRAIFSIHEPSPTIRGVNRPIPKNYQIHPNDASDILPSLRPLSTQERSYIQTFPQSFEFIGSKTVCEQLIGNAVPVKLAEHVAHCIKVYQSR